ncbi:Phospholipid scramblase [Salix suchowensis]|nr:Phospholipid scramblase [Salix suchowensis]
MQKTKEMEARSCTSTSCFFSGRKDSRCHHKAVEFACSACLFCVFCPLSIVWCCIKLPCKIGCRAAGQARKRFPRCCHCGSEKKFYSSYSSFSDMDDSDIRPSKQGNSHHKHSFGPSDITQGQG